MAAAAALGAKQAAQRVALAGSTLGDPQRACRRLPKATSLPGASTKLPLDIIHVYAQCSFF
jgi:hypothetical protein